MKSANKGGDGDNQFLTQRPKQEMPRSESKGASIPANDPSQSRNHDTMCFTCQGRGHIASQCLNQKAVMVLSNGEIFTDDEAEYERMPPLIEETSEIEELPRCSLVKGDRNY